MVTRIRRTVVALACAGAAASCGGGDTPAAPVNQVTPVTPVVATLVEQGQGVLTSRYTAEISAGARYAYSSTWGTRAGGGRGDMVYVWDLAAGAPLLVDSVQVANAGTTGDVQVVPEANLLVVAVEPNVHGAIVLYDITDAAHPRLITRYETPNTINGVHTAQVSAVNGRLYAFLSIDPRGPERAKLVIVDITAPASPQEVWVREMGAPFVHDVHVRDGILITAEWNDGAAAYDIGGGGRGGTPAAPVLLGRVVTKGGAVHNVFWQRDAVSGSRYLLVGEEGAGAIGSSSVGDIHVVDVSSWSAMREVAFFTVAGAGTHNFWVDEGAGVLYAAYYNAGVRALDVRGDLAGCAASARDAQGRCDLGRMGRELARGVVTGRYVWGVDGAPGSVLASDMLGGVWRLGRVVR